MDKAQFWNLIEQSREGFSAANRDGSLERQRVRLGALLQALSASEVLAFREMLWARVAEAYSEELWDAAYVIGSGCSSDLFDDFRAWLISMGEHAYRDALADPESLVGPASAPDVEDAFFEGFLWVPDEVYESKTALAAPRIERGEPRRRRPLVEAEVRQRFPILWAKFQRR